MKLSTSTGDFGKYVSTIPEEVRCFKGSKFKYLNLEQTSRGIEAYLSNNDDDYRRLAHECGEAAAYAGKEFVVSHAPCLDPYKVLTDENYNVTVRAIRRSIEVCHMFGIERIVVHGTFVEHFAQMEYFEKSKKFYSEFFDLMEKYNIMVLTENSDCLHTPLSSGKEMREFVEYIDHPLFGVCWDTAHGNLNPRVRREGQYKSIIDIGDKLKGLHIADNFGNGAHHHTWPFAGNINFDEIMQGLLDVNYDGYFNFEASYTLCHCTNPPFGRRAWEHNGETVTKLLSPSIELKAKAVDLLYDVGEHILRTYDCFEE